MLCVICKTGTTYKGKTTSTIESNGRLLVFKNVDAEICNNCGEAYFSPEIIQQLQSLADEAFKKGAEVEIVKLP